MISRTLAVCAAIFAAASAGAAAGTATAPPLSPAQVALFETPHLSNIDRPEALEYAYAREGDGGFTDRVLVRIQDLHPDGTKYVSFDYLSGEHHVMFPAVDSFAGNPLLMLFLEHDVRLMKEATGVPAAYYRDRIRAAFVDEAEVTQTLIARDGQVMNARRVALRPFAADPRFAHAPAIQAKTYTFVLADGVPGMLAELVAETPANAADGTPATGERLTFTREVP